MIWATKRWGGLGEIRHEGFPDNHGGFAGMLGKDASNVVRDDAGLKSQLLRGDPEGHSESVEELSRRPYFTSLDAADVCVGHAD